MEQLISGAMSMGYTVAGLFFLRFWKRTRDRLFLLFALAFWVLAGQRLALGLAASSTENQAGLYLVRLVAFLLILGAIIDKNRSAT